MLEKFEYGTPPQPASLLPDYETPYLPLCSYQYFLNVPSIRNLPL